MFPFFEIGQLILLNFSFIVILPIFWVVIGLVFIQYRRTNHMEASLLGQPYNQLWEKVIYSLLLGIAGGLLASFVLVFLGFTLDIVGIPLMLGFAILLLFINPRFLCFAYAVGLLALVVFLSRLTLSLLPALEENVVFSTLANIYLPNLLVLVAVLHLTEALLIYLGGHWNASPVFFKGSHGKVIGGFTLQRFWPVPLVVIYILLEPEAALEQATTVPMPDWWPLLETPVAPGIGKTIIYTLLPVAAALGYADMAISSTPRQKSIYSSRYLALYSIVLLFLALVSVLYHQLVILAVLFAFLGHEGVVLLGNKREMLEKPRYLPPAGYGVKVLAVFPDSPAEQAGLQTEDVIREVNREKIKDSKHFWQILWEGYFWAHLLIEREGEQKSLVLQRNSRHNRYSLPNQKRKPRPFPARTLGLVLVPEADSPVFVELKKSSFLNKIKNKFSRS